MLEYLFVLLYYCNTVVTEISSSCVYLSCKKCVYKMHLAQFVPSIVAVSAALGGHWAAVPGSCSPCPGIAPRLRTAPCRQEELPGAATEVKHSVAKKQIC